MVLRESCFFPKDLGLFFGFLFFSSFSLSPRSSPVRERWGEGVSYLTLFLALFSFSFIFLYLFLYLSISSSSSSSSVSFPERSRPYRGYHSTQLLVTMTDPNRYSSSISRAVTGTGTVTDVPRRSGDGPLPAAGSDGLLHSTYPYKLYGTTLWFLPRAESAEQRTGTENRCLRNFGKGMDRVFSE